MADFIGGGVPIPPALAPTLAAFSPQQSSAPAVAPRPASNYAQSVAFWQDKGVPPHVAQGISDALMGESGMNPDAFNPAGGGQGALGVGQWRGPRQEALSQQPNAGDLGTQLKFAYGEVTGGDPIAAAHWKEIQNAPDRATAKKLWSQYFERPGGGAPSADMGKYNKAFGGFQKAIDDFKFATKDAHAGDEVFSREYRKMEGKLNDTIERMNTALGQKPEVPTPDIGKLGSAATIIGLVAGMFAKRPLMGMLNAGAASIAAQNQGDWDRYKAANDQWKSQSDMLLHIADLQQKQLHDIMEDRQKTMAEKMAEAKSFLEANQMTYQLQLAEAGLPDKLNQSILAQQQAHAKLSKDLADAYKAQAQADAIRKSGSATPGRVGTEAQFIQGKLASEEARLGRELTPAESTEVEKQGHSEWAKSGVKGRSAPAILMNKLEEEHPDWTADELSKAYGHLQMWQTIERTFASGPTGRNLISLNTVADHILRVEQYADALRNGQIPRANAIANTIAKESGKPEVTTFEAGRTIMADEVVRLLTSTGGTEADRSGMQTIMSSMSSPEQFAGLFNVFKDFTGARFLAMRQDYARGDKDREQYFNDHMLTEDGRKVFSAMKPASAATSEYKSADDVAAAYKAGRISRDDAANLLRDNGWAH